MVLLDTNVVSELMRPNPDTRVEAWLSRRIAASVFIARSRGAEIATRDSGGFTDCGIGVINPWNGYESAGAVLP